MNTSVFNIVLSLHPFPSRLSRLRGYVTERTKEYPCNRIAPDNQYPDAEAFRSVSRLQHVFSGRRPESSTFVYLRNNILSTLFVHTQPYKPTALQLCSSTTPCRSTCPTLTTCHRWRVCRRAAPGVSLIPRMVAKRTSTARST